MTGSNGSCWLACAADPRCKQTARAAERPVDSITRLSIKNVVSLLLLEFYLLFHFMNSTERFHVYSRF